MTDTLAKLFGSAARVKLLRLFVFNPSAFFTVTDASSRARVSAVETRHELESFHKLGLLTRTTRGRFVRYAVNIDFEYLTALQNLLLNASKRADTIYKRMRPTGAFKLIVVAGVFMGEWDGSKIDLLIVGDRVREDKLHRVIRLEEAEVGKELRYALLSTQEFLYRLSMNDHLLRDVLDFPHRIVLDRLDIGLE